MRILGMNVTRDAPYDAQAHRAALGYTQAEQRASPENPRYSLDDPAILDVLNMTAGSVSPQQALRTSAVYACVRVLAETLAALPLHVYERSSANRDDVTPAESLPLYTVLHDKPNDYQTSYVWREQGETHCALWGNHYSEIQRDLRSGDVIALHPLMPWDLVPFLDGTTKRFRSGRNGAILSDADVLHVPALGWDGIAGLSPVALQRATMSMSLSADEFGASFYNNGTRLSGVLQHPGKLGKPGIENLRESWTSIYSGKQNAGKVAVLEEGMTFNALTMPLEDAQYIETRQFQVSDIARIYRVPPHMIGQLERATFSNIEQQSIEFVVHTMMPWIVKWEQEINAKCFTPAQRGRFFARFNVDGLLRGDTKSRYEAYAIGRTGGWLSVNDILRKENMNQVPDGDGHIEPLNMKPLGSVSPEPKAPPTPPAQGE